MWIFSFLVSLALIVLMLVDGFEAMVLPRRVTRLYRPTRLYFRSIWTVWRQAALGIRAGKKRQAFLSVFGPLSMLGLFAGWVSGLVFGFGLLHWSVGTSVNRPESEMNLTDYLYLSGTTFFTVGGDITAIGAFGRFLTVFEGGLGLGFLAVIIGYLPVLYQAFSRREVTISLLDARAGSPPTAAQVLIRMAQSEHVASVHSLLAEWERWAAELLESHLSFPVLSYYRSQHDNQSWLAGLTAILDTCSLLIVGTKRVDPYQAQLTFAMARHAVVDLALIFKTAPVAPDPDRLPSEQFRQLRDSVHRAGLEMRQDRAMESKLAEVRAMYEPFLNALANYFIFSLPGYLPDEDKPDNWQTSAWTVRTAGIGRLSAADNRDEHF